MINDRHIERKYRRIQVVKSGFKDEATVYGCTGALLTAIFEGSFFRVVRLKKGEECRYKKSLKQQSYGKSFVDGWFAIAFFFHRKFLWYIFLEFIKIMIVNDIDKEGAVLYSICTRKKRFHAADERAEMDWQKGFAHGAAGRRRRVLA